jgi:GntR family transcriptional regulator
MIEEGEYGPGERIPSERKLSSRLGVSRMTVRRAVENLIALGMLERRSTSGTFVREPRVVRRVGDEAVQSLTQQLLEESAKPGSELIHFERLRAPRQVAGPLRLRVGEHVLLLRRRRLANDLPICVETSYLPHKLFPELRQEQLTGDVSLYQLIEEHYGVRPRSSEDLLLVSRATEEEARWLGLEPGAAVLFMRSVILDDQDRAIEYVKSVNHPRRVAFRGARSLTVDAR